MKKKVQYKTLHINEVHSVGFEPSTSRLTVRYNDCMTNSQSTYSLLASVIANKTQTT